MRGRLPEPSSRHRPPRTHALYPMRSFARVGKAEWAHAQPFAPPLLQK